MKLQKSKLCVNCEALYEQLARCPYCGSEIFVWLSRALGTTIEEEMAEMNTGCGSVWENPASPKPAYRSESPATAFAGTVIGSKSFTEFRLACGRVGREMVRVLTLGLAQAFK